MDHVKKEDVVFREVQKFHQVWVLIPVLAVAGLQWYAMVQQLILRKPFGDQPMPDSALVILWILVGVGLPALLFFGRLTTEVRCDGIYIRFSPFHWSFRRIAFSDISQFEVRTYQPLREYGGWGIRFTCRGKAYSVSGNQGVQIDLTDGRHILIGSRRAEELWRAIQAESGWLEDQRA